MVHPVFPEVMEFPRKMATQEDPDLMVIQALLDHLVRMVRSVSQEKQEKTHSIASAQDMLFQLEPVRNLVTCWW